MEEQFGNYTKKRVALIAYLAGVRMSNIENGAFDTEYLSEIKDNEDIRIIRSLSELRLNFLLSYDRILSIKREQGPFAQFGTMKEINAEALAFLNSKGLNPLDIGVTVDEFTKHIANINELIEENIDRIHGYIPEWIKWEYIRDLFIMPDCASGKNGCYYQNKNKANKIFSKIHSERKNYYEYRNRNFYPYGVYLNWNENKMQDDYGNIFFNDSKFLKLVYASHYDTFKGEEYVIDAKESVKNNIYEFIDAAQNVAIFVDCENVDPYRLASVFKNLDEEKVGKIKNVTLYDDVNTTNAWDIFEQNLKLPVTHKLIERVLDDKSLVDMSMAVGAAMDFAQRGVESIILASSDSDFWGLISTLPDARYFVMNESDKTSEAILRKLDDNMIGHCFMDDFAKDAVQGFKNCVLKRNFESMINEFNSTGKIYSLNVDELVDRVFFLSGITGHYRQLEAEKEDFIKRYVKGGLKLRMDKNDNGELILRLSVEPVN